MGPARRIRSPSLPSLSLLLLALAGCAADGAPVEGDLVVTEAGLEAPVEIGTRCHFRLRPAWRRGVDCQLLVTCPAAGARTEDLDLFGGRRVGGYAVCETEDHAFVAARDGDPLDGDPAIDLDLAANVLRWRDRRAEQRLVLALAGAPRPTDWPEDE